MSNQKISPAPGGGKTRPVGSSDPRTGVSPSMKGSPLPQGKANGKVFANYSPAETCGPGHGVSYAGPTMKGAPKKDPTFETNSRGRALVK